MSAGLKACSLRQKSIGSDSDYSCAEWVVLAGCADDSEAARDDTFTLALM
jgi:hypothetical protein